MSDFAADCDEDARERALLMSMLSHDLRGPLASILGGLHQLRRRRLGDSDYMLVERLHACARRMSRIVDLLLDFEYGRNIPLLRRQFDLGELCAEVVDELEAGQGIKVSLNQLGDTTGEWDRDRLARVISNLVGNALVHGDLNSAALTVDGRGNDVVIACHNTGPPINSELFSRLFDPFARGARSAGLGLGLYIVARAVQEHGGRISVSSTFDDGTTFTVRLPRLPFGRIVDTGTI